MSGYANKINYQQHPGLGDIITSPYARVDVIDRFPKSGLQPSGTSFSVEVEVQTYVTGGPAVFRTPFQCLDAFVAVRGLNQYQNRILGGNFVRTFLTSNCHGKTRIVFDPVFRPTADSFVQFELYPGGSVEWFQEPTNLQMVQEGKVEPIAVSQPMNFFQSLEQGRQNGVYGSKNDSVWATAVGGDMTTTLRNAALLAGIGFAGYFLVLNSGAIKAVVDKAVEKYTDDE
jgi:hypothetical protein